MLAMDTTEDRLLRRAEVERLVGMPTSTLYRAMRAGRFPEPFRVGFKAVRWSKREVERWIAALPHSHGDANGRPARALTPPPTRR